MFSKEQFIKVAVDLPPLLILIDVESVLQFLHPCCGSHGIVFLEPSFLADVLRLVRDRHAEAQIHPLTKI